MKKAIPVIALANHITFVTKRKKPEVIKLLKNHNKAINGLSNLDIDRATAKALEDVNFRKQYSALSNDLNQLSANGDNQYFYAPDLDINTDINFDPIDLSGGGSSGSGGDGDSWYNSGTTAQLVGGIFNFASTWFASKEQRNLLDAKIELNNATNQAQIDLAQKKLDFAKMQLDASGQQPFNPTQNNTPIYVGLGVLGVLVLGVVVFVATRRRRPAIAPQV